MSVCVCMCCVCLRARERACVCLDHARKYERRELHRRDKIRINKKENGRKSIRHEKKEKEEEKEEEGGGTMNL